MNIITFIIIFIIILAVLYYYYFVMVKHGNLLFWQKATKNPDFVYEQFSQDHAWVIDDGTTAIDKTDLDGPFLLYIPNLGKTIKFYGRVGKYEDSQKRIGENL